jgi:hypothetical protein
MTDGLLHGFERFGININPEHAITSAGVRQPASQFEVVGEIICATPSLVAWPHSHCHDHSVLADDSNSFHKLLRTG